MFNIVRQIREWIREQTSEWEARDGISFWMLCAIVIGTFFAYFGSPPLVWGQAALATGILLGFLFGIPRVKQNLGVPGSGGEQPAYRQAVNTNLEEISDWLTKIIVGIGLIELGTIPRQFQSLAEYVATKEYPAHIAGAIIMFFLVTGFLVGYLSTRIFLAHAFSKADQALSRIRKNIRQLKEKVPAGLSSAAAQNIIESADDLVDTSPTAAVVDAWKELYQSAYEALGRTKQGGGRVSRLASGIIHDLSTLGMITPEQANVFEKLREIRNDLVYVRGVKISPSIAKDYINYAAPLIAHLKSVRPQNPPAEGNQEP